MPGEVQGWQKRQALGVVAMLPESTEDALIVLDLARGLVESFLLDEKPQRRGAALAVVAPFAGGSSAA